MIITEGSTIMREGIFNLPQVPKEGTDFVGEDGLLYCGVCRKPKEKYLPRDLAAMLKRDRRPAECDCQRERREREEARRERVRHLDAVEKLRREGFLDRSMAGWRFEKDNGRCPQMKILRDYARRFEEMRQENIGLLLWGGVGAGKSFGAGCVANDLIEREIPVKMTNFAAILGDLSAAPEGRGAYIDRLCAYPLLILDDFGMERGTEYGLEQVYNVIDTRCRVGKPLIVTTNLPLSDLRHPGDLPHQRIYDRVLAMCCPVCFTGESFRRETAQEKLERLRGKIH